MLKCKHENGLRFSVDIRGFKIFTDVRPEKGGEDSAPEPPEYMHAALLTCTATYFLFYCNQHNIPSEGFEVSIDMEAAEAPPRIAKYYLMFKFPPDFPEKRKKAAKAYMNACPVGNTLKSGCEIEHVFM